MFEVLPLGTAGCGEVMTFRGDRLSAMFHALTWSVLRARPMAVVDCRGALVCTVRRGRVFLNGTESDVASVVELRASRSTAA